MRFIIQHSDFNFYGTAVPELTLNRNFRSCSCAREPNSAWPTKGQNSTRYFSNVTFRHSLILLSLPSTKPFIAAFPPGPSSFHAFPPSFISSSPSRRSAGIPHLSLEKGYCRIPSGSSRRRCSSCRGDVNFPAFERPRSRDYFTWKNRLHARKLVARS